MRGSGDGAEGAVTCAPIGICAAAELTLVAASSRAAASDVLRIGRRA